MFKNKAFYTYIALLLAGVTFFVLARTTSGTSAAERSSANYGIEMDEVTAGGEGSTESTNYRTEKAVAGEAAQAASAESTNYGIYGGNEPTLGTSPEAPSALMQYLSDGTTVITTGEWIGSDTVVFKFTMSDPDPSNYLTPQVEIRITADAFTGTPNYSGIEVPYSGTPVTGVVTVSAISNNHSYHWQARVVDDENRRSPFVSFGGNAETAMDFGIIEIPSIEVWVSTTGSDETGDGTIGDPYRTIAFSLTKVATRGAVIAFGGTYDEYNISWPNRNYITLKASLETTPATIEAGTNGRCINVANALSLTIEGFTLQNGKVDGYGAGIYLTSGSSLWLDQFTVKSCSVEGSNWAGAIYSDGSTINANDCTFSDNHANHAGVAYGGTWTVTNSMISGNSAAGAGGVAWYGAWTVTNSIISGNSAGGNGGVANVSSWVVINCTFYGNTSSQFGGGIACNSTGWHAKNSIFAGGTWYKFTGVSGSMECCDVDTGTLIGPPTIACMQADPLFVSAEGGDYHLSAGSPCIDTGTAEGAPITDLDGKARPYGLGGDMGAYEFQGASVRIIQPNGGEKCAANTVYKIMWQVSPEATDIHVRFSSNEGASWIEPPVTQEAWTHKGVCTFEWTVPSQATNECLISIEAYGNSLWHYDTSNTTFEILTDLIPPVVTLEAPNGGQVLYAGQIYNILWSATDNTTLATNPITLRYSTNEGASWTNITTGCANSGSYPWTVPAISSNKYLVSIEAKDSSNNTSFDTSNSTFEVLQLSVIYISSTTGSDETGTGTIEAPFKTIQKGLDNVTAGGTVNLFPGTYKGTGNRSISWPNNNNLILRISPEATSPATIDAESGGRIFNVAYGVNLTIESVTIQNGYLSPGTGGGIYLAAGSSLWLKGVTIKNCIVYGYGGAVQAAANNVKVYASKCQFIGNKAYYTGSMTYGLGGVGHLGIWEAVDCLFSGNYSEYGGVFEGWGASGNSYWGSTNCTFYNNTGYGSIAESVYSWTSKNDIIWGNGSTLFDGVTKTFTYSDVQGGVQSGTGNISSDPKFVNASGGNFKLMSTSPCIGSATSEGAPSYDILGNKRPHNSSYEMGAYEFMGPYLKVNAPNGGEAYLPGGSIVITWTATDEYGFSSSPPPITINFSSDGGSTWTLVTNETNSLIYTWEAPSVDSNQCRISIEAVNSSSESSVDMSDANFTISSLAIVYVSPSGSDETGTGTYEAPYRTVQKGLDSVIAAGQVRMLPGTYTLEAGEYVGGYMVNWPNKANVTLTLSPDATMPATIDAQGAGMGSAIYIAYNVSATIKNITIQNGYTDDDGAAINATGNLSSGLPNLTVTDCTFLGNYSGGINNWSGGAVYATRFNLWISNCLFKNNTSTTSDPGGAGAVALNGGNYENCKITNCLFYKNTGDYCGAVLLYKYKYATVESCTFVSNEAKYLGLGGGIYTGCTLGNNRGFINNCIFWANVAESEGSQIYDEESSPGGTLGKKPIVSYSVIQGGDAGVANIIWGAGTTEADPLFASNDEASPDFLRLSRGSLCIDRATSSGAPSNDLAGNFRPKGFGNDMGAYEFQGPSVRVTYPNGGERFAPETICTITWEAVDETYGIQSNIKLWYTRNAGIDWVTIESGLPNTGSYDWTTPSIASDQFLISIEATNNSSIKNCDTSDNPFTIPLDIVYVLPEGSDITGTGKYEAPLRTIKKGVRCVAAGGQVRLLPGIHTQEASSYLDGAMANWPNVNDITLRLSPEAVGSATIDARDLGRMFNLPYPVNLTIEGVTMINGDGTTGNGGGVIYSTVTTVTHEVYLINVICSSDVGGMGYPIYGGVVKGAGLIHIIAQDSVFKENGAGWGGVSGGSDWTATNCTFEGNDGMYGGAIGEGGIWNVTNCTFKNNTAVYYGSSSGGIAEYGTWIVDNCSFIANEARYGGISYNSDWTVTNSTFKNNWNSGDGYGGLVSSGTWNVYDCTFEGNSASQYGGIQYGGTLNASNCAFSNNFSGNYGGIVADCTFTATNCVFSRNHARNASDGGGIARGGTVNLTNCTLYGNTAEVGGVAHSSTWTSINSIYWGNSDSTNTLFYNMSPTISYSDIQTCEVWPAGTGNISLEPRFVSVAEGSEDYRLGPASPCMDNATGEGAPSNDKAGKARPRGFGFDIGAYEFQGSSIRVDDPNDGQTLNLGTNYVIRWTTSPVASPNTITIRLSTNGGNSWDTLVASGAPDSGVLTWEVTGGLSTECLISIEATSNGIWNYDISDLPFVIIVSMYPPTNLTGEALPRTPQPYYVRLYWNASTAESEGYYVYRGLTYETYEISPISALVGATTYEDHTVATKEDYYYAVKTYGYGEYSDYSNDASAPLMRMTRTVTVDAPISGGYSGDPHDPVPGAIIKYTIKYENIGFAPAKKIIINDRIPNYTDYKVDSATGEAATSIRFSSGGITYEYTPSGIVDANVTHISWEVEDMGAGGLKLCTFEVVIE